MSQRQAVPLEEIFHGSQSQVEAVKELEQLFCLDKPTLLNIVESFQKELVAGLADDRSSDLNMIPTYVTGKNYLEKWTCLTGKSHDFCLKVIQLVMKKAHTLL